MTTPANSEEYQRQARFQEAIAPEVNRLFRLALAIVDDSGEQRKPCRKRS